MKILLFPVDYDPMVASGYTCKDNGFRGNVEPADQSDIRRQKELESQAVVVECEKPPHFRWHQVLPEN